MLYVFEHFNNEASWADGDTLTEQDKTKGIAIEELPLKQELLGKEAILKCRKSTNEVWWECRDKILSPDEEATKIIRQLEQENAMLKSRLENAEQENLMNMMALVELHILILAQGGGN